MLRPNRKTTPKNKFFQLFEFAFSFLFSIRFFVHMGSSNVINKICQIFKFKELGQGTEYNVQRGEKETNRKMRTTEKVIVVRNL